MLCLTLIKHLVWKHHYTHQLWSARVSCILSFLFLGNRSFIYHGLTLVLEWLFKLSCYRLEPVNPFSFILNSPDIVYKTAAHKIIGSLNTLLTQVMIEEFRLLLLLDLFFHTSLVCSHSTFSHCNPLFSLSELVYLQLDVFNQVEMHWVAAPWLANVHTARSRTGVPNKVTRECMLLPRQSLSLLLGSLNTEWFSDSPDLTSAFSFTRISHVTYFCLVWSSRS